jgi:amidohydrolase
VRALMADAESILPTVVALRRQIHRRPETGLDLPLTQGVVTDRLDALGIAYRRGKALSSVVGTITGAAPGGDVVLRADMDALPVHEESGVAFASQTDGVMHACGHDTHVAMLLGAAELLAGRRDQLAGRVTLMFQPGEEGFGGAERMIEEGLLDGLDPAATRAFAVHTTAAFESGTVNLRPGPFLAAPDSFEIDIVGRGGHASEPHRTVDPIPVAAELIMALQAAVTRRIDVHDPAVLSVTRIAAGTSHNIVPAQAFLQGTIRSLSPQTRSAAHALLERVAANVAAAHGASARVRITPGYPPTVNDAAVTALAQQVATELVGPDAVRLMPAPRMGGEDFSYVLRRVPGAMVFLGARPSTVDPATAPMNHSNRVVFDESVFPVGVALHAAFALRANGMGRSDQ